MGEENPLFEYLRPYLDRFPYTTDLPSQEQLRSSIDEGVLPLPFYQPDPPEFDPVQIDPTAVKDAIEGYAEAKINAARDGVKSTRDFVDQASQNLLASTLAPGIFKMITGTEMDIDNRQAQALQMEAVRQLARERRELGQAENLSPAEAQLSAAETQQRADQYNAEQVYSNAIQNYELRAQAEAQGFTNVRDYIDFLTSFAANDRKFAADQAYKDRYLDISRTRAERTGTGSNRLSDFDKNKFQARAAFSRLQDLMTQRDEIGRLYSQLVDIDLSDRNDNNPEYAELRERFKQISPMSELNLQMADLDPSTFQDIQNYLDSERNKLSDDYFRSIEGYDPRLFNLPTELTDDVLRNFELEDLPPVGQGVAAPTSGGGSTSTTTTTTEKFKVPVRETVVPTDTTTTTVVEPEEAEAPIPQWKFGAMLRDSEIDTSPERLQRLLDEGRIEAEWIPEGALDAAPDSTGRPRPEDILSRAQERATEEERAAAEAEQEEERKQQEAERLQEERDAWKQAISKLERMDGAEEDIAEARQLLMDVEMDLLRIQDPAAYEQKIIDRSSVFNPARQ